MLTLRRVHTLQDTRGSVSLEDGRIGKIVRVDTTFPDNETVVSVYTAGPGGPGLQKVRLNGLFESNRAETLKAG